MSGKTCSKTQSPCSVLFEAFLPQNPGLSNQAFLFRIF
jgi:hypothetical protein